MSILLRIAVGLAVGAGVAASAQAPDFVRDIRPILSDNCFACHGPDDRQRMGDLRLDTKDGAFAKRKNGAAVAPGDLQSSLLYRRVTAADVAQKMPPAFSGKTLNAKQVALLKAWIENGAAWNSTHWAYVPPQRPELPAVGNAAWARNPIDRFILARLEREGLKPSPEGDRATLIRRASLDLTGLPPAPVEVDAFLADQSADAYEKVVDRLLRSPHYGERMAMQWLDLARYADTHGYHIDSHRDMWHWRDWIVGAFNRNLPFDQFTTWQIAGDLLPDAGREQRLATGFNRNHMINFEGGAIPEEYQVEYVVDRVETTSTVWLGSTMGCARCHDHKYDPFKQKEFYEFFAFFNNVAEKGLDGRRGNAEPMLPLGTGEQERVKAELAAALKKQEEAVSEKVVGPLMAEWEKARVATLPVPSREALAAHYEFDNQLSDVSGNYRHGRAARGDVTYGEGIVGRAATLSGETQVDFGAAAPQSGAFTIAVWLRGSGTREAAVFQQIDSPEDRRGFELLIEDSFPIPDLRRAAHLRVRLTHRWPGDAIELRTREPLQLTAKEGGSPWHHITVRYDGSGKAAGLAIYDNGRAMSAEVRKDSLTGGFHSSALLSSGNKALANPFKGTLDDLRVYSRALDDKEIEQLAVHEPIRAVLTSGVAPEKRSRDQRARLREYFLTRDAPDAVRREYAELNRLKDQLDGLEKAIPTAMVMAEQEKPRETFVLGRGDYRNKTAKVEPGLPAAWPPLPEDAPRNRLGLARWLTDPSNPLTARVTVNRYWQMYFGAGLVKTSEDFGSQGDVPSHPDLLDWLATEFVRSGWDVRAMQRLIVTSAAYRQSSRATPALIERDPENRLLARGPRFRLPAELVRDNALAAAGLLTRAMGGPGVYPYQPKGLWEEISYGDVYSAQTYSPSRGEDLYRRSMYTFWKRTSPPPSLATFDAPDREKCVARRARTNTPLQALVLMNDPTYVEASRALAVRLLREAPAAPRAAESRIRLAYRLATARLPQPAEIALLQKLAARQLEHYRKDKRAAQELLSVGDSPADPALDRSELAAWTTVASVILNLDETITKQ